MRSAMRAASQLLGRGPTDVDDALHLHVNQISDYDFKVIMIKFNLKQTLHFREHVW